MSRQLKISEDVYQMLLLLKTSPETTFSSVILDLIEGICPWLPASLENLKQLEQANPQEAAAERILLQSEIFKNVLVEMYIEKQEREKEYAIDKYLAEQDPEQYKTRRENEEKMRKEQRQKILFGEPDKRKPIDENTPRYV